MTTVIDKMLEDYFKWIEEGGNEEMIRDEIIKLIQVKQMINLRDC